MKRTGLALLGLVIVLAFLPAPFSVHAAGHECTRPVARVTALDPLSGEAWNWGPVGRGSRVDIPYTRNCIRRLKDA